MSELLVKKKEKILYNTAKKKLNIKSNNYIKKNKQPISKTSFHIETII